MNLMTIIVSFWGSLQGCATSKAQVFQHVCPNPDFQETPLDCPWAPVSRSLEDLGNPDLMSVTLEKEIPGFLDQVRTDARFPELLPLWGLSNNFDVSAPQVPTIPKDLLAYLNTILNAPYSNDMQIGHAGLNHTYGYLFSTVQTPYGYKRARYVQGEIEKGFGLPQKTFGGVAAQGTLMANLTGFIGSISFDPNSSSAKTLRTLFEKKDSPISPAIRKFNFNQLAQGQKIRRLIETADLSSVAPEWTLTLQTDIVEFLHPIKESKNEALLIYTIDLHRQNEPSQPQLITAFPVAKDFGEALFKQPGINLDVQVDLKVKYNGALPSELAKKLAAGFKGQRSRGSIPRSKT